MNFAYGVVKISVETGYTWLTKWDQILATSCDVAFWSKHFPALLIKRGQQNEMLKRFNCTVCPRFETSSSYRGKLSYKMFKNKYPKKCSEIINLKTLMTLEYNIKFLNCIEYSSKVGWNFYNSVMIKFNPYMSKNRPLPADNLGKAKIPKC